MGRNQLDLIVGDGGLGSLLAGYLIASKGRTVCVVGRPELGGTTTVSVVAARRVEPLRHLVDASPVIASRRAVVLQPEGGVSVGMASARMQDDALAVAVVDRSAAADALLGAIRSVDGCVHLGSGVPSILESGALLGVRDAAGVGHTARCSILSSSDVDRLFGMPDEPPAVPASAVECEWRFTLDRATVRERFLLSGSTATEWWLYGDPFDGAGGVARLRAFGATITLSVILPLEHVLAEQIEVSRFADVLRSHPYLAPLFEGGVSTQVAARTVAMTGPTIGAWLGDGWVRAPAALSNQVAALTTEIAMAEEIAEEVDAALASPRVSAARLAGLPGRLRRAAGSSETVPLGPVDAWADELVVDPARLVTGARLLAERFAGAR